ncbi:MAG: transcriptional repressor [Acidimicrobiales bacterium]
MTTAPERTSAERVEEVLSLLRARGGRVTTARRQLLEALFASAGHRTAEDLAAEIQARAPDIHLSTIYRNLDELERLGVIVHTHLGHGPASYHLSSSAHGHLVCERCGLTLEAPEELFASLSKGAEGRFGFHIDPRHFAVLGRCAGCSTSTRRPSSGDE